MAEVKWRPVVGSRGRAYTLAMSRLFRSALILLALASIPACAAAKPAKPVQLDVSTVHAVLVNGGGSQRINYQSHLLHLRQIHGVLRDSGVDPSRITVFTADGEDPGEDTALREGTTDPEGIWRLRGTKAYSTVRAPVVYESSAMDGVELRAARQEEIGSWFETEGKKLVAGDTLLVYVTDHGNKNAKDLSDNTIRLWGKDDEGKAESLSVSELRAMLSELPDGVRVVTLMSQCFSGSFANLAGALADDDAIRPDGSVCGYFSATADRKAYGCYARNLGKENVGHSFRFIHALAVSGSFTEAHDEILVSDATPDVPLRTSDVFLQEVLGRAAKAQGEEFSAFVDRLLAEAWRDKAAWETEVRLLDRIGRAFGYFSPRTLAELDERSARLPSIAGQLENVSRAWSESLRDSNYGNFDRFLKAHPAWELRLAEAVGADFDQDVADKTSRDLLGDLVPFTAKDLEADGRIATVHENAEDSGAMSYRMEVRLAVMLRMRTVLIRVAGRHYLSGATDPADLRAYEALAGCEDIRIERSPDSVTGLSVPEIFPPYEDDVKMATAALPAWMGIRFRDVEPAVREKRELAEGATRILHVFPESPAAEAGLKAGDLVTGPPGRPFREPKRIRSWTMLSEVGREAPIEVFREDERLELTLVPGDYPLEWPELPGPPEVGDSAPAVDLEFYRGNADAVSEGKPYLLYFWATWCGPCKLAVPELLELERDTGIQVIAITDEAEEQLDKFFAKRKDEFLPTVAIDRIRQNFIRYGVSGTPTFVYVDEKGTVVSHTVGYDKNKGLSEAIPKRD